MEYLKVLRKSHRLSEPALAEKTGLARETIRAYERGGMPIRLDTLSKICHALDHSACLLVYPNQDVETELSVAGVSYQIMKDGFESWKIHLMNFVDGFRKTRGVRLILLPPPLDLDERLYALIQSIVLVLCQEIGMDCPSWVLKETFLSEPWFVSGFESLKSSALLESRYEFRRNNIFVLENFLERA